MKPSTYILVHGAWHDSSCWHKLVTQLKLAGHHVLTPTLPGHGADTLNPAKISFKRYLDALATLLNTTEQPVILLGHSMAGMLVSALACAYPDKIKALVFLCAYLPRDGESLFDLITQNRASLGPAPIESAMQVGEDKRLCTISDEQIIPLFYPLLAPAEAAQAKAAFRIQPMLPLATAANIPAEIFKQLNSVYICCSEDQVIPLQHQRLMLQRQPVSTMLQIPADHSPFLSSPEELGGLLLALAED